MPKIFLLFLMVTITCLSCRKDFDYSPSNGDLRFSKDTVFLDTIFSGIGSATYLLKVYNDSKEDIEIPSISLESGLESNYRLNVEGVAGKMFSDIPINSKDSLFIFIETNHSITNDSTNQMLYSDILNFDVGSKQQKVPLVTLIKNAIFLYSQENSNVTTEPIPLYTDHQGNEVSIKPFDLSAEHLTLNNEKPYVIYGYAKVPDGDKLIIEPGARLYFHKNSGIYINKESSIEINGSASVDTLALENEIIFQGDRLIDDYSEIAGQWGGLIIDQGEVESRIEHLTLKNAINGLTIKGQTSSLHLKNSQIYNSSSINLHAISADIRSDNVVFGNAGINSVKISAGGRYSFQHCTIANYWSQGFRVGSTLEIDNSASLIAEVENSDLIQAEFINSIVTGNGNNEIYLSDNQSNSFSFFFQNSLIRFSGNNGGEGLYDFENQELYKNVFFNEDEGFNNSLQNDFRLQSSSFVIDKGASETLNDLPLEVLGNERTNPPDLGAFEFVTVPD